MDQFWTRNEQEQYVLRMEDEHRRQNNRIQELEDAVKENNKLLIIIEKLTSNMEKLASNMDAVKKEQKEQGKKLEALESRDGQKWTDISKYVITSVIGLILGYFFNLLI